MVIVDLNNHVLSGKLRPSSDTKTHALLYRTFLNIGGIAHTHSTFATAWAQAELPIPILGTTHADHLPVSVPCTAVLTDEQIDNDYEEETGNQILQVFSGLSYEDVEMVLVARHGPFTWGRTPRQAVYNSVIVEELAKMAQLTLSLKHDTPTLKKKLVEKHYFRKHGKDAYYGQK
jgi:L-ribulose-5-phosphate 4-epimerase